MTELRQIPAAKQSLGAVRREFSPWDDPAVTPFIEFQSVTKRFGSFVAVEDQSLQVFRKEFFALLGPSGCGKTTLLRMLAGFEDPSEGAILLDGESLTGVPPYRRPVNMMFQSYALFPHMSVAKNIAFGLRQDRMARSEIDDRVSEMLSLVKLGDFAKRKPHQLSGGQRQRVALARALAKQPKVLLLDEPLGALDKKLREETQFELMNLQEELGLTFMIVTHDQEEAMTMADRIAVMDHGKIVQTATPAEIYEAPASRYVAGFVGDINIFPGRLDGLKSDLVRLNHTDLEIEVSLASHDAGTEADLRKAASGCEVWFAIRPEKVSISAERPGVKSGEISSERAVNCVEGEVWDIAYLGDMTVYNVRLSSGQIVRASRLNASRTTDQPIVWEDRVWLNWDADCGLVLTR